MIPQTKKRVTPQTRAVLSAEEAEEKLRAWRATQAAEIGSLWGDELILSDAELCKLAKDAKKFLKASEMPVAPKHRNEVFLMLGVVSKRIRTK